MLFSGHDTFHCRLFWLKKGYDYIIENNKFSDSSGVDLGVGRNMVNSIRFWLKAFGVVDDKYTLQPNFTKIFSDDGWDPYLENEASLWLLHYSLNAHNYSSIYQLIFKDFRKIKPEFSRENLVDYIKDLDASQNTKILEKDFSVFLRMYKPQEKQNAEDAYSGLLTELSLVTEIGKNQKGQSLYRVENKNQREIPLEILLYCILSNKNYGRSISFKSLYSDPAGIGDIFCFDEDILEEKLIALPEKFSYITYNSEAGIKELQFKGDKPNPELILNSFYDGEA